jgi:hypothetical protein
VARAKRTDRAEARRQYRAYLAAQAEAQAAADAEAVPDEDGSASTRPTRTRDAEIAHKPGERLGVMGSLRAATRTPHYVDDLRNIGPLVVGTRAIWPVAAICLLSALVAYPRIGPNTVVADDPILSVIFQFVLYPLPLLPPMMAGFLAPRSTWLAGAIAALISTVTLIALVVATQFKIEASTTTITGANVLGITVSWLSVALPFGALIGAASGWYKRFLDLMGGGRQRSGAKSSSQKRPARRGQTTRR